MNIVGTLALQLLAVHAVHRQGSASGPTRGCAEGAQRNPPFGSPLPPCASAPPGVAVAVIVAVVVVVVVVAVVASAAIVVVVARAGAGVVAAVVAAAVAAVVVVVGVVVVAAVDATDGRETAAAPHSMAWQTGHVARRDRPRRDVPGCQTGRFQSHRRACLSCAAAWGDLAGHWQTAWGGRGGVVRLAEGE